MDLSTLAEQYSSGDFVAVLGCELFKIQVNSSEYVNIHEYIIRKSFQKSDDWPEPPKFLSELQFSRPGFNQQNVKSLMKQIVPKQKRTDLLNKLARLKNFNIFIIASFYKDFEDEFKALNTDEEIDVYKNSIDGSHNSNEINFNNGKRKIFYLFDNVDNTRFAMNDEELLEAVFRLATPTTNNSMASLPSVLKGKTLLFIGCDFSDWFMRYCIRVLCNEPLNRASKVYIVNDNPSSLNYQEFFFRKHNIEIMHSFPVDKFVNDFFDLAITQEKQEDLYYGSQIFISYKRNNDSLTAQKLNNFLKNNGINTWIDEDEKTTGEHIEQIKEIIFSPKTKVMISVISKSLCESLTDHKSYIRDIEWDTALTRIRGQKWFNKDDKFCIIPYYVDDPKTYTNGAERIPEEITNRFQFGEKFGGFENLGNQIKIHLHEEQPF